MTETTGNALIGQSGGPTAVINQSLVGLIEELTASPRVRGVIGALHGVQGLLGGDLIDLGRETKRDLEAVARTPAAALGSVRKKPNEEECQQILDRLRTLDVRWFFYIGGNDSAETAHVIERQARAQGAELTLIHVPKTIDNDLCVTDHCPGYGSAARFVALAAMGNARDNRSLPGIKIDVIMGRNAGWLTAASVLARQHEDDGPHLVYVPENDFSVTGFLADVERVWRQLGRCFVAVSEGVHGPGGAPLFERGGERDSHGNLRVSDTGALASFLAGQIQRGLGAKLRVRADTFGYVQRSMAGVVSEVDAAEARAVGRAGARAALEPGAPSGSMVILREEGERYRVRYERVELERLARVTRPLERRYLRGASDLDPSFLDYVRPLVGRLPRMGRLAQHPWRPGATSARARLSR